MVSSDNQTMKSHGLAKQFPPSSEGGNSVIGVSRNERNNETQFGRVFIDDNSHDQMNNPPPIINNEVATIVETSLERHLNHMKVKQEQLS